MLAPVSERAQDEATHDRIGAVLEPVHRELVERLKPEQGDRWLDLTHGSTVAAIAWLWPEARLGQTMDIARGSR
jgi:hypothetical protein